MGCIGLAVSFRRVIGNDYLYSKPEKNLIPNQGEVSNCMEIFQDISQIRESDCIIQRFLTDIGLRTTWRIHQNLVERNQESRELEFGKYICQKFGLWPEIGKGKRWRFSDIFRILSLGIDEPIMFYIFHMIMDLLSEILGDLKNLLYHIVQGNFFILLEIGALFREFLV